MQDWGPGVNLQRRLPRQPNLLLLKCLQLSPIRTMSPHVHLQEICMDVLILVDLVAVPQIGKWFSLSCALAALF
jgi:hypothetical protein